MRRLLAAVFAAVLATSFVSFPDDTAAYARCNCTAWAHSKRRDLPLTLSHARYWASRARARGFPVDAKPRVGDVMVLQPGVQGAHRRYGHVAYVIAVKGNLVTVSEMNGGRGCRVKRETYRAGRGVSFIHPKGKAPAKEKVSAASLSAKAPDGGNIRKAPDLKTGKVLGKMRSSEVVTLKARSADGTWYRVVARAGEGWVRASLLDIDPDVARKVPRAG